MQYIILKNRRPPMDLFELCDLIDLQNDVIDEVKKFNSIYCHDVLSSMWNKLFCRDTWDEGIQELQKQFGDDPDGIKILTCILHCSLHTFELYREKEIDTQIFIDTVKFLTRFIEEHKKIHGSYRYTWAWWFPRQLALQEFRLGTLEYEFTSNGNIPQTFIHIPSDAILEKKHLQSSYSQYKKFVSRYFSKYKNAELYCDSWLLVPELKQFLNENSNILYFQNSFEIISVDNESRAFMDWLYPNSDAKFNNLPENTSLQRKVKQHLLNGGKIGWAMGRLKKF